MNDGRTFVRNKKFLRKYHGNSQERNNNGVVENDKKKAPSKQSNENTRVVGNDKKKALAGNDALIRNGNDALFNE